MELQEALEQRYSCRQFTDQVPTKEQIEAVLDAGRLAPTACNYQSQHFFVAMGPENLAKIDQASKCRYNAPVCIVVAYDEQVCAHHGQIAGDDGRPYEDWSFGDLDATSAIVQMLLKATDLGMCTCWLGAFKEETLRQQFDIPESMRVRAIIDLGFPGEKGGPSPMHTKRKELEEYTTWL